MKWILATIVAFFSSVALANTSCDEWATMTQVLVIRWQGDATFKGKDANSVKKELSKHMESHPELPKALGYVDFAYKHRKENPVDVWKQVYKQCSNVFI